MPPINVNSVIRQVPKPLSHIQKSALLSGSLFGVKDNFASGVTTNGSNILQNYESPFEATAISLLREAGAQLTCKLNMDEFGMGSANVFSHFGPTLNPRFPETAHVAGGSSGGSAAAVAQKIVDFSLGTDTGGSVRLPASFCGVLGFKPTYGRVSRWGVTAYAQTLDTVGIMARDVGTIKKVLKVLDVHDTKDPTSLLERSRYQNNQRSGPLRIGILQELLVEELTKENRDLMESALASFATSGHEIHAVSIPLVEKCVPAYYTIATAEAASNLARYDGIRYGVSTLEGQNNDEQSSKSIIERIAETRTSGFGEEVKRRLILGNYTLSSDSGDHYARATLVRERLVKEFDTIFRQLNVLNGSGGNPDGVDLLLSPTSIGNVPTLDEYLTDNKQNFLDSYANDLMTIPSSLAGLPAVSIPFKGKGIQLMGQFGDDFTVLQGAETLLMAQDRER